ncbi:hypothetical protein L1987_79401 [Smallanthus sonchifolius]|uniref:Uncharacterized protein n=1 Tax=Smallanthus sonchifolius TaxID=185202 RepID=A0ACB8ZFP4_9ASTR|nr:hypothetical protein L1987_79401 [Smallanthus sonchifolius]
MVMAGWHLSRNKFLFFSGALFITLAVCIHLIPHFPSFFPKPPPTVLFQQESCISLLNNVSFRSNSDRFSWDWDTGYGSLDCEFQKLGRVDVSDLLNGSWVVVAGDLQARLFMVALVLGVDEMEKIHDDDSGLGLSVEHIWEGEDPQT